MKIKKITFKQLKENILKDEIEFRKEIMNANKKSFDEIKTYVEGIKEDFEEINNLDDLLGWFDSEGFKEHESYEQIIGCFVKDYRK